jgi:hypothetical protein
MLLRANALSNDFIASPALAKFRIPQSSVHGRAGVAASICRQAIRTICRHRAVACGVAIRVGRFAAAQSKDLSGVIDMKTLRIVAICAAALIAGQASAQEKEVASGDAPPPVAQDVGGTSPMSQSDSGSALTASRQQVYQNLIQSQQSGEQARLRKDVYFGAR